MNGLTVRENLNLFFDLKGSNIHDREDKISNILKYLYLINK